LASDATAMTTYDLGSDLHADLRTTLREEGRIATDEPLHAIERRLIGFSLGIGLALLAVLAMVNHFFPAAT
jgi:hypothetical protein